MRLRDDPQGDRAPDKRGLQGAWAERYVQRDLHPRVRDHLEDRARQLQQQQGLPILLTEATHAQQRGTSGGASAPRPLHTSGGSTGRHFAPSSSRVATIVQLEPGISGLWDDLARRVRAPNPELAWS